ncbi:MAG: TolC family protein [Gemmatimonadota bacterium]
MKRAWMRWGGAWLLAVVGAVPVLGQETISLDEAIERALTRSPAYAQSSAAVENAASGRRTAIGSFLPSIATSSGASLSSTQRFDQATQRQVEGSSTSYSAGLSASYDLFDGFRNVRQLELSNADVSAATARQDRQRFDVILQTKSSFFAALRQGELLVVQESRVRRADESLANIRRRVELGSATRSDSLRARLELANARQAELQARAALRAAQFALGRQVGSEGPVVPEQPATLEPATLALGDQEIYRIAVENSPDVIAAAADERAAQAGVGSARAAWFPSLSVSSGMTWNNNQAALSGGNSSWNLRLSASYPIFNGFARESQIDRAEASARVSSLARTDAELRAREAADGALQTLRTAEEAIEIANEAALVAAEDLRVIEERYRVGVATILDLITSQIAVEEAEANQVFARYDYLLARAELESILGREL